MEQPENYFEKLVKIDVSEHMEKKGKFSYLSWSWAVDQLRKAEPSATWEVIRHNGFPYMKTECGYFVEVAVTVQGITLSQIHPVLDNNNRPIAQPNAFQINTSIQRCLVKAIALHGLGLYIYSGEDLPDTGEDEAPKTPQEIGQARLEREQAKADARQQNTATGELASEPQVKMLNVKAGAAGYKATDKQALMEEVSRLIGHTVESFTQVLKGDVQKIVNWLESQAKAS